MGIYRTTAMIAQSKRADNRPVRNNASISTFDVV